MELKVWVEGIQRVICGVTEGTTCQDVVIALAHATGKTGRFTLVEKWRENERLVAPSENPLCILQKWGEYATDVTFILRHSEKARSETNRRTDKFSHNFSPHGSFKRGNTSIRKSLTFSGAHGYVPQKLAKPLINDISSVDSLDDHSSSSSHSSISPYASFEKKGNSPRISPSINYGSLDRHRQRPNPRCVALTNGSTPPVGSVNSAFRAVSQAKQTGVTNNNNHLVDDTRLTRGDSLDKQLLIAEKDKRSGHFDHSVFTGKAAHQQKQETEDLYNLIKLQDERLELQETQIKMIESEMKFWEERDRELTKQSTILEEEINRLLSREKEVEKEISDLDSANWNDKLEVEKQNEKMLQAELTLIRSKLANCETELLQHKNKSHKLNEEIGVEKQNQTKLEEEFHEQENRLSQEIVQVQAQISRSLAQQGERQHRLDECESEVSVLDDSLSSRKTELANLEKDIKDINLEMFTTIPADWNKSTSAEDDLPCQLSTSRPGSLRKMTGNPISLKEAAVTPKNPEGMWV